jgi:hypothetical protein
MNLRLGTVEVGRSEGDRPPNTSAGLSLQQNVRHKKKVPAEAAEKKH